MSWTKEDINFKKLVNVLQTSDQKAFYEEFGEFALDLDSSDIKSIPIPFDDPTAAETKGVVSKQTLFSLTKDVTVGNAQAWKAETGGNRVRNWVHKKWGSSYDIKLYDGNDAQIFPTDALNWIWLAKTGYLLINGNANGKTHPFKVTGYLEQGQTGLWEDYSALSHAATVVWDTKFQREPSRSIELDTGELAFTLDIQNVRSNATGILRIKQLVAGTISIQAPANSYGLNSLGLAGGGAGGNNIEIPGEAGDRHLVTFNTIDVAGTIEFLWNILTNAN